jgi:hypothetical protein
MVDLHIVFVRMLVPSMFLLFSVRSVLLIVDAEIVFLVPSNLQEPVFDRYVDCPEMAEDIQVSQRVIPYSQVVAEAIAR